MISCASQKRVLHLAVTRPFLPKIFSRHFSLHKEPALKPGNPTKKQHLRYLLHAVLHHPYDQSRQNQITEFPNIDGALSVVGIGIGAQAHQNTHKAPRRADSHHTLFTSTCTQNVPLPIILLMPARPVSKRASEREGIVRTRREKVGYTYTCMYI